MGYGFIILNWFIYSIYLSHIVYATKIKNCLSKCLKLLNIYPFQLVEVEIKNGTARTINSDKDPFSKMVYQDSLVTEADLNDAFMVCEARFDESIHLGMITPTWSSPTLKNVEHTDRYNFVSWRNESFRTVGSRLTLRHPSNMQSFQYIYVLLLGDKLETYGKYTCIFAFEDIGQVEWDVYLKS